MQAHNGMHPAADTLPVMLWQRLGAGDAVRKAARDTAI